MAIAMIPHPAPIAIPMTRSDPEPLAAFPLLPTVVPVVAVAAVAELAVSVPVVEATVETVDEEIAANVLAADVFAISTALRVVSGLGVKDIVVDKTVVGVVMVVEIGNPS